MKTTTAIVEIHQPDYRVRLLHFVAITQFWGQTPCALHNIFLPLWMDIAKNQQRFLQVLIKQSAYITCLTASLVASLGISMFKKRMILWIRRESYLGSLSIITLRQKLIDYRFCHQWHCG